ncbi:MAG: FkbM family methyltransferase [Armatimonadetes bacterium]|nr:FkbM family methyltransferase [Armatimonadota bacterium]
MGIVRSVGKIVLALLPADSETVYRFGKAIVDRHNNDNNCDPARNGENRVMRELLPGAKVIFDVGANLGDWTSDALKANRDAQYHCFEPSPVTFKSLSSRGLGPNVKLNNCGLSDKAGEFTFYVFGDDSPMNSLYERRGLEAKPIGQELVRMDTLDAYCAREGIKKIDFFKLDVEGHELSVLNGGRETFANGRVGMMQFEYGGNYIDARTLLKDIFEFFQEVNPDYAFHKVYPNELRPIPAYQQTLETFQYSNWVIKNNRWNG